MKDPECTDDAPLFWHVSEQERQSKIHKKSFLIRTTLGRRSDINRRIYSLSSFFDNIHKKAITSGITQNLMIY